MSDDGAVIAEKRSRGRPSKPTETNDKEIKDTKKRGRPAGKNPVVKADKKTDVDGEPTAKRGRGRPKKSPGKAKPKVKSTGKGRGRPSKKTEKEESSEENGESEETED
ncbi:high mobility group protein I [Daktulosphaira vitifoliae]|uniref:high mobility group protein I n=1 Tax=Daktulosphaira vitifoliae TaxID=58002 RepID=UPI0021A9C605|nr:high mobility group protein I [Daktulosphaira vitifoliae]